MPGMRVSDTNPTITPRLAKLSFFFSRISISVVERAPTLIGPNGRFAAEVWVRPTACFLYTRTHVYKKSFFFFFLLLTLYTQRMPLLRRQRDFFFPFYSFQKYLMISFCFSRGAFKAHSTISKNIPSISLPLIL